MTHWPEEYKRVESKEDFIKFTRMLGKDFTGNKDQWENQSLDQYLEALAAWVHDMDGAFKNANQPVPKDVPWGLFARMLYAAKIYE